MRETAPLRWLALVIATGAGSGYAPIAPGTFGSAFAVVLYLGLVSAGVGPLLYLLIVALLTGVGIWAADVAERSFEKKDDGRIVIDEVAGQLLTLAPLVAFARPELHRSPLLLLVGFLLFRLLDIWKPGPVRQAEREFAGGAGVVLDDVVAGLLGAVVMTLLLWGFA